MKTAIRTLIIAVALCAFAAPAFAQSGQPFGSPSEPAEPADEPTEDSAEDPEEPAGESADQSDQSAQQSTNARSSSQPGMTTPTVEKTSEPAFHAGDIDIMVGGGLGGLAYPHIEPSVDIGIVPITDDFSISVGGGVDFGWCLLCAALDAVSPNLDFASSYIRPYGRVLFHLGTLGGLLDDLGGSDYTIDLNGGLMGGPAFYSFTVTEENTANPAKYESSTTSVVLGPLIGGRLGFADNTFFLFLEYRFLAELGFSSASFETGDGETIVYDNTDTYNQDGSDFMLGLGFRI